MKKKKICIIGGAGHVGFPLGLMIASKGNKVFLHDIDDESCHLINKNISPYYEINSGKFLKKYKKNLIAGNDDRFIIKSDIIIICIGTPVKKDATPDLKKFFSPKNFLRFPQKSFIFNSEWRKKRHLGF